MRIDTRYCVRVQDIAQGPLDVATALGFVDDPGFGGFDLFLGQVRSASHGRDVVAIHYDMFDPLALQVFERAAREAVETYGPQLKVYVAHAKGRLQVGQPAVIVAVGSPHRDAAFRACRAVIEAVKHQAPIWKQEHFVDGASAWSEGCSLCEGAHAPLQPAV